MSFSQYIGKTCFVKNVKNNGFLTDKVATTLQVQCVLEQSPESEWLVEKDESSDRYTFLNVSTQKYLARVVDIGYYEVKTATEKSEDSLWTIKEVSPETFHLINRDMAIFSSSILSVAFTPLDCENPENFPKEFILIIKQ